MTKVQCECGQVTGVMCSWEGPESETVTVEWMPVYLRSSHVAAGNSGIYPHNGAVHLTLEKSCAQSLVESDPEWTEIVQ